MQEFDYEKLADLIFDRIMQKQDEYEREAEQSEHQIAEMARLETLISLYEQQEKYEHAAIIQKKLRKLKDRLIKNGIINE